MADFITGITDIISGVFEAIVNALGSTGSLIFTVGETGAITGVSAFGWLVVLLIGLPVATWLINKLFGLINRMRVAK